MELKNNAVGNTQRILDNFPRTFRSKDLKERFGWSDAQIRQALVYAQMNDYIQIVSQPKIYGRNDDRRVEFSVYENLRWRKEWVTRAWRTHGEMASQEQTAS